MKRFSLLCVLAILCSLPAYSQFWISFGWNEPHCQNLLLDGASDAFARSPSSGIP